MTAESPSNHHLLKSYLYIKIQLKCYQFHKFLPLPILLQQKIICLSVLLWLALFNPL